MSNPPPDFSAPSLILQTNKELLSKAQEHFPPAYRESMQAKSEESLMARYVIAKQVDIRENQITCDKIASFRKR